jgi:hypothetical protein
MPLQLLERTGKLKFAPHCWSLLIDHIDTRAMPLDCANDRSG